MLYLGLQWFFAQLMPFWPFFQRNQNGLKSEKEAWPHNSNFMFSAQNISINWQEKLRYFQKVHFATFFISTPLLNKKAMFKQIWCICHLAVEIVYMWTLAVCWNDWSFSNSAVLEAASPPERVSTFVSCKEILFMSFLTQLSKVFLFI